MNMSPFLFEGWRPLLKFLFGLFVNFFLLLEFFEFMPNFLLAAEIFSEGASISSLLTIEKSFVACPFVYGVLFM